MKRRLSDWLLRLAAKFNPKLKLELALEDRGWKREQVAPGGIKLREAEKPR